MSYVLEMLKRYVRLGEDNPHINTSDVMVTIKSIIELDDRLKVLEAKLEKANFQENNKNTFGVVDGYCETGLISQERKKEVFMYLAKKHGIELSTDFQEAINEENKFDG